MTEQAVLDLGGRALLVALQVAAPPLIVTMVVGLVVSIFQAATQINEQTLTFIPKIVLMTVTFVIAGPWIVQIMVRFSTETIKQIAEVGRY